MSSKSKTLRAFASSRETLKEEATPALVPKLQFPEFRDKAEWHIEKIDDLVDTVTPPKKLPTSNYAATGAFPIIDQSQNDICGWTDENDALIQADLPLIVFGDHTCILKLIDRPFAQGADGIKILKSRPKIGTSFLYQFLNYRPVVTEEYKRHYSILKEKLVAFPDFKTGEQQKIAECLSSVDELIAAQARKVDALKTHKKGLMQQLFPREGETQPRLRFPEFQNAGEWVEGELGDKVDLLSGYPFDGSDIVQDSSGIPLLRGINVTEGRIRHNPEIDRYYTGSIDGLEKFRLESNDLVIGMDGSKVGKNSALVSEADAGALLIQRVARLRAKKTSLIQFIFQRIHSPSFHTYVDRINKSSGIPHISAKQIKEFRISFPPEAEQQRIASCLSSLDALITAETHKHEALKTHKKGLMQQLFPSPEEVEA